MSHARLVLPYKWGGKSSIIYAHDLFVAGLSLVLALNLRLGLTPFTDYSLSLLTSVALFVAIAGVSFHAFGMYRSVWRYASIPDLLAIMKAASLAVLIFMPVMFLINRLDEIPRSVPIIQWLVLVMMLGGSRLAYRSMRTGYLTPDGYKRMALTRSVRKIPVLLAGTCEDAELFIRAMTSDPEASYRVVGILDDRGEHLGRSMHGVPVLGTTSQLTDVARSLSARGLRPQRVILTSPRSQPEADTIQLLEEADRLGLAVARLPRLVDFKTALNSNDVDRKIELRPVALEDLLERPQIPLNRNDIRQLIATRKVLVTGAGGTIGSELTRQIAALSPAALVLIDSSEFNLYSIDLEIREKHPDLSCEPMLCNIRDSERVLEIFADHRPELVFHAAALKHVPIVERNPSEGLLTNVIGTRNVADAAARCGALAMVQVSTDKAINPSSIMGASKRLAELYCQSLDLVGARNGSSPESWPRLMTVRFGNVLGSSGSVVPLFERQLSRGGPLTVTHPEIRRFFMTVREAVELVLQASAHGVAHPEHRGQIFVLDMGKPIKVVDIARQMIRLAGLRPDVDVAIEFTGLRPGEKLYEELFDEAETRLPAAIDGIFVAASHPIDLGLLRRAFDELGVACRGQDHETMRDVIAHVLPSYRARSSDVRGVKLKPDLRAHELAMS